MSYVYDNKKIVLAMLSIIKQITYVLTYLNTFPIAICIIYFSDSSYYL